MEHAANIWNLKNLLIIVEGRNHRCALFFGVSLETLYKTKTIQKEKNIDKYQL